MNKSFFLMIGCIISQHAVLAILPEPEVDKYCDEKPVVMTHDSLIFRINQEYTISLLTGVEKTTGEPVDWCWLEEESAGLLVLERKEVVWPPRGAFIWFPSICYTFKAVKPGQRMLVFTRPNKDSDSKQVYWIADFMVSE